MGWKIVAQKDGKEVADSGQRRVTENVAKLHARDRNRFDPRNDGSKWVAKKGD
jgi:hypothetical protein